MSAAFSDLDTKTPQGRGRHHDTRAKPGVPNVETLQCRPAFGLLGIINHELENRRGKVICRWCGSTWAHLDAEVRGA